MDGASGHGTMTAMSGMKHTNLNEGLWTGLRNFLRSFRGIPKAYLDDYVAIYEFHVNLKKVSPTFISSLVRWHSF
jgi:transposase-like protein